MPAAIVVDIQAENYHQAAVEVAAKAAIGSIAEVRARDFVPTKYSALESALGLLRRYIAPSGCVTVYGDTQNVSDDDFHELSIVAGVPVMVPGQHVNMGGIFGGLLPSGASSSAVGQMSTDMQQAQTIFAQMQADSQQQQMERLKIMQDMQTQIFKAQQDVTTNRSTTNDRGYNKFDSYIRG
jgi:hypothetical protein